MTYPYLTYSVFSEFLDNLKESDLMDSQIADSLSDSDLENNQILSALRFFELVDRNDKPTSLLIGYVRKLYTKEIFYNNLLQKYSQIFQNDLTITSFDELVKIFESNNFGVSGQTAVRAVNFFVKLGKDAGADIPEHLNRKRGRPKNFLAETMMSLADPKKKVLIETVSRAMNNTRNHLTKRTVILKNGGELTLSISGDLYDLDGSDREFVFDLIDRMKGYENESAQQ